MKNLILAVAGLFCFHFSMAQWSNYPAPNVDVTPGLPDDSFLLTPDTLKFLTGNDFIDGKEFSIVNPHNYPLDVQHIDNFGIPCPNCLLWYITPFVAGYPVTIPANGSLTFMVRFVVVDAASSIVVHDTLNVNTTGNSGRVIIAADSSMILIGMEEPGTGQIVASPNPFNDRLTISIGVKSEINAEVIIYNSLGQQVRELFSGIISPSFNRLFWDGTDRCGGRVKNGMYFIHVKTTFWQKMLMVVKV